ncbi:MAG: DUF1997 domain-containing protein [Cyanobacterium sp. T60_A2020_053]|nr:DUF1997 domain-containing protein [Cyanobacterium sp. T60_A2020_053]
MATEKPQPFAFSTQFRGSVDMYGEPKRVTEYLNDHQGWFVRCALPMKAEPFGDNGYTLIIGRYGAFGYEVEPQMSVILEPPHSGRYAMYSVHNPDFNHEGYEVNYHSQMEIVGIELTEMDESISEVWQQKSIDYLSKEFTRINWQLDLQVKVRFPKFIYKLPHNLIQKTGDNLLIQIIKQVSPRLSFKIQKDFHTRFDLPLPPKSSRSCEVVKS